MNARGALLCIVCLCACAYPLAGCSENPDPVQLTLYEDSQGQFSIGIPVDWETAPEISSWRLYAGEPSKGEDWRFDATIGLAWGRPPCDWMLVDDVVAWYADRWSAGESHEEPSRVETEVDGRRAMQVEYEVSWETGVVSRELTWFTEAYGTVWQITCTAMDGERYAEYVSTFQSIGDSFRVYGSWSPAG